MAAYQVQVSGKTTTWDVLDVIVDIDDEDVDMMDDDDQPLRCVLMDQPTAPDGGYKVRVRRWMWPAIIQSGPRWLRSVDTTPPPVPGMPTTDSPTNDTTPTWTWAWDEESEPGDFSHFNVYLDGVKVNEDDEVKQPTYTIPDELALSDGPCEVCQRLQRKREVRFGRTDTAAPEILTMDPMPEFALGDHVLMAAAATFIQRGWRQT